MGMAASQARFLGLTARKNNVEFEGQQINQQRTALSNQSANYYNDLLGMSVPVPPSVDDFTKTVYTFEDGALTNQITAMMAQPNGEYTVSYLRQWKDDFSVVVASTSIINKTQSGEDLEFRVGSAKLRILGALKDEDYKKENYFELDGVELKRAEAELINDKKYSSYVYKDSSSNEQKLYLSTDDDGNETWYKETGSHYEFNGFPLKKSEDENSNVEIDDVECEVYTYTDNENKEHKLYLQTDKDGKQIWYQPSPDDDNNVVELEKAPSLIRDLIKAEENAPSKKSRITSEYGGNDEYLKTLSADQLEKLLKEEEQYIELLKNKYGDDSSYMVRYIKNTTTNEYNPYFYKEADLLTAIYDNTTGNSQSNINCYKIGTETKTEEVKALQGCKIEKDSSGRYINITIPMYNEDGTYESDRGITYALTTSTVTDQDAYKDAMNQYEYEKNEYDQAINEINSKIEIIQSQDKNLELRLKQLDTEHTAIQTEVEAVSGVIKKNSESSFKTFG